MAQRQVGARTEGDVFQGMFFWHQAALLLRPSSLVKRVAIEFDQAAGVDDVAVFYGPPGINAAGRPCFADFYQLKYHVDQSQQYGSDCIIDPAFIGAKRSLLQRFHDAHLKLKDQVGDWYLLHLVSNWQWKPNDPLGPLLRESEGGALPEKFFTDGPKSELGKIRKNWQDHLGVQGAEFEDFARRLRFGVNFFGRRHLRAWLNDRLVSVGLSELKAEQAHSVYDSLVQQFVMSGPNEFEPGSFQEMCEREGLLNPHATTAETPKIGVRSFMRMAENMEAECDRFVCVTEHFDGRHARNLNLWQGEIKLAAQKFLADPAYRAQEYHILLDCHLSLAFLAGYELDRKSGAQVFPVQKGTPTAVWKPSGQQTPDASWSETRTELADTSADVAIAVSVTRDALADVKRLVEQVGTFGAIVDARPAVGVGAKLVQGADHAIALADNLAELIRKHRPGPGGSVHLFLSAPNAFAYFLGQHRGALGKIQLYEFDFEGEQGGSYSPSLRLPS